MGESIRPRKKGTLSEPTAGAGTMPVMVPDQVPPTAEIAALCVAVVDDLHAVRAGLAHYPSKRQVDVA